MKLFLREPLDLHHSGDQQDRIHSIGASIQRAMAVIVIISFVGYGLAGVLWFYGELLVAVLVATLAFMLFRAMRPTAYAVTRMRLASKPGFGDSFARIDRAAEEHGLTSALAELQRQSSRATGE